MVGKEVLDKKQRETWNKNHNAIMKAVIKIEASLRDATFSKIKKQLKKDGKTLSDPTISKHLKSFVNEKKLIKKGNIYSRKIKLFAEALYKEIVVSESLSNIPLIEGKAFEEYLSRHTPTINQMIEEYKKKCKNPLTAWRYKQKLEDLRLKKQEIQFYIRKKLEKEREYFDKATEIKVLASKKLHNLDICKIGNTFSEILFSVLHQERGLAEAQGKEFSMKDFGLCIAMIFDPKRAEEPPSFASNLDLIERQQKLGAIVEQDKRLWASMKQTELKRLEDIKYFEEEANRINAGGWDVDCPHYLGYIADQLKNDKVDHIDKPKECSICPRLLDCVRIEDGY